MQTVRLVVGGVDESAGKSSRYGFLKDEGKRSHLDLINVRRPYLSIVSHFLNVVNMKVAHADSSGFGFSVELLQRGPKAFSVCSIGARYMYEKQVYIASASADLFNTLQ